MPLGEPQGESKDRAIDWGYPRLKTEFGCLEEITDWSSHSGSQKEWEIRGSLVQEEILLCELEELQEPLSCLGLKLHTRLCFFFSFIGSGIMARGFCFSLSSVPSSHGYFGTNYRGAVPTCFR